MHSKVLLLSFLATAALAQNSVGAGAGFVAQAVTQAGEAVSDPSATAAEAPSTGLSVSSGNEEAPACEGEACQVPMEASSSEMPTAEAPSTTEMPAEMSTDAVDSCPHGGCHASSMDEMKMCGHEGCMKSMEMQMCGHEGCMQTQDKVTVTEEKTKTETLHEVKTMTEVMHATETIVETMTETMHETATETMVEKVTETMIETMTEEKPVTETQIMEVTMHETMIETSLVPTTRVQIEKQTETEVSTAFKTETVTSHVVMPTTIMHTVISTETMEDTKFVTHVSTSVETKEVTSTEIQEHTMFATKTVVEQGTTSYGWDTYTPYYPTKAAHQKYETTEAAADCCGSAHDSTTAMAHDMTTSAKYAAMADESIAHETVADIGAQQTAVAGTVRSIGVGCFIAATGQTQAPAVSGAASASASAPAAIKPYKRYAKRF